ncbi:hypothetical protein KI387_041392, partial [Taxus chinensis]
GTKNINASLSRQEKLVSRDISRGSRQKSILENVHRTAALLRAAVTGPPPCSGRRSRGPAAPQGGGFVTEDQK